MSITLTRKKPVVDGRSIIAGALNGFRETKKQLLAGIAQVEAERERNEVALQNITLENAELHVQRTQAQVALNAVNAILGEG